MNITCPSCTAQFRVDVAALGPRGRKVRCSRCKHEWIAQPPLSAPAAVAPALAAAAPAAAIAAPALGEAAGQRQAPPPADLPVAEGWPVGTVVGWLLLAFVVVAGAGAFVEREAVMARWPQTVQVFTAFGLGPAGAVSAEPFGISEVTYSRVVEDGVNVLRVEGRITNQTRSARPLPTLKGALRDSGNREVQAWTFAAGESGAQIAPGQSLRFRTELKNPAESGASISIGVAPL